MRRHIFFILCSLLPWACVHAGDTISIAVTGDVMMGTTYPKPQLPSDSGRYLFEEASMILRSADIALGNLEGTLCDGGKCSKKGGKYSYAFRTPTGFAARLTEAGYDYMSMANNHANDFGLEGILSSEQCLAKEGIGYSGILGRNEWVVIERNGTRFGICAFGHNRYTLKHRRLNEVKRILDTLRAQSDIVIVSFHGGAEGAAYNHLPEGPEQFIGEDRGDLRLFTHFCIDNGADVVYGHGPHVVRCVEVYKGRLIAYSLGNFCTPYGVNLLGINGYAPVISILTNREGELIQAQIHPFIQQRGKGPRIDHTGVVTREIRSLSQSDVPYSEAYIDETGTIIPYVKKIESPRLFFTIEKWQVK